MKLNDAATPPRPKIIMRVCLAARACSAVHAKVKSPGSGGSEKSRFIAGDEALQGEMKVDGKAGLDTGHGIWRNSWREERTSSCG